MLENVDNSTYQRLVHLFVALIFSTSKSTLSENVLILKPAHNESNKLGCFLSDTMSNHADRPSAEKLLDVCLKNNTVKTDN